MPIADASESVDETADGFGELRVEHDGATVKGDGLLNLSRVLDGVGEVREGDVLSSRGVEVSARNRSRKDETAHESRVEIDGLLVHGYGLRKLTHILEERAEVGVKVRVLGIELEACLVVLQRELL